MLRTFWVWIYFGLILTVIKTCLLTINGGVLAHGIYLHNVFNRTRFILPLQKRHPEIKPDTSKGAVNLFKPKLNEWKGAENSYNYDPLLHCRRQRRCRCLIILNMFPYDEAPDKTPPAPNRHSSDDFDNAKSFLYSASVNRGPCGLLWVTNTPKIQHWIVASLPSETNPQHGFLRRRSVSIIP